MTDIDSSEVPGRAGTIAPAGGVATPLADTAAPTAARMADLWADPPGLRGRIAAVQNDKIGKRLLYTGFFFLLLGGSVDSLVMRLQLAVPDNDVVSAQVYNELFTNHGSVTMFLVILPIVEGFAILLLPFLLGTREMPFPRLGAYSFFTYLMGGLFYYSSTLFNAVPDAGWFAYTPLSLPEFSPGLNLDFWVLGLSVAEVAAIAAGIEIIITILKFRAPGMTLNRMPLFGWAMLVTAFMILFAFTPLIVGSFLLELSRSFDMKFFSPDHGGSSLLWQHLFWIFGHPEVYIQFLPAAGIVSTILPVFVRRRIAGYRWLVAAFMSIGFMSFALWAHHMFAVGLPPVVLGFFSAASMAIAIPAGIQVVAWLVTLWSGRPVWKTPLLFVMGFLFTFVLGGITGVMVAAAPLDLQVHDSYFVVAHLHYVLIGGVAFPLFAGAYYWLPKFSGRLLNERLGKWNFWLMFVGVHVTFFPMHIVGLMGMPRRVYSYDESTGWGPYNLASTVGAFITFSGVLVFLVNLAYSRFRGQVAGPNPWDADTLEWSVSSPPPDHGFSIPPIVTSRHPLWDQAVLHRGDPSTEGLVRGLADWPLTWRAALMTGLNDARPEEVLRVPGPSLWPFVTACATVLFFIGEMVHQTALLGFAALAILGSVIMWNRPQVRRSTDREDTAFATAHGVQVRSTGSPTLTAWAVGLALLVVAIAFATFLLAYFYLRVESPVWPPPGVARPALGRAALAALAMLAGVLTLARGARRARHAVHAGTDQDRVAGKDEDHAAAGESGETTGEGRPVRPRGLRTSLAVAAGFMAVATSVLLADVATAMNFSAQSHAYGSIFYTLVGFLLVVAAVVVVVDLVVLGQVWNLELSLAQQAALQTVNRFASATAVIWLIGLATLYLLPRLT